MAIDLSQKISDIFAGLDARMTIAEAGQPTPSPTPTPVGFYSNDAANNKWKTALARVKAGTGRAKIVWKGDSTTVGQGGGTGTLGLIAARPNRIPAVVAAQLSSRGYPSLDNGIVFDNSVNGGGVSLAAYDPRVTVNSFDMFTEQTFAGGGFFNLNGTLSFAVPAADTAELIYYNSASGTITPKIDDAAPATGPASITIANDATNGIGRSTIRAASVGNHTYGYAQTTGLASRGLHVYSSTTPAVDMIVHAQCGATSSHQAASGGQNWQNNESLGFDAPDLAIINCGLNDMSQGIAVATYIANLQAMITRAKISGDVLLMFPHPAGSSFNNGVATFHAQAKALAASAGVAFFSLYEYFGSAFSAALQARMYDGTVHGKAELYAEEGQQVSNCLLAMAA